MHISHKITKSIYIYQLLLYLLFIIDMIYNVKEVLLLPSELEDNNIDLRTIHNSPCMHSGTGNADDEEKRSQLCRRNDKESCG